MSNANEPAFPLIEQRDEPGQRFGLTKREHFAAMAMQGFMANKARPTNFLPEDDAAYCVAIADALIAELERTA